MMSVVVMMIWIPVIVLAGALFVGLILAAAAVGVGEAIEGRREAMFPDSPPSLTPIERPSIPGARAA